MGLSEQLAGVIPDGEIRDFSSRFDVTGDIAIVTLSPALQKYDQIIAETIIKHRHGIRTVAKKSARVTGDFRTARYDSITGNGTVTTHREYGFSSHLDLNTSFFNPRLAQEQRRVTGQVRAGESVLVPFCGVGSFVIPAAARDASVVAIEQNPDACRFLQREHQEKPG